MTHGGRRPGAGRKAGSVNAKTREIADRAAREGITPLEVMVAVMREQWHLYRRDKRNTEAAKAALTAAKDAAPYLHPRPTPIDNPVKLEGLQGGLTEQGNAVMAALADGTLTPQQAGTLMQAIAAQARIIEVDQLEKRVAALEGKQT